jgi:hypothetical protein
MSSSSGTLSIQSTPPGATVSIDGKPAGVTPVTLDTMAIGTHTVELQSPDYQTSAFSVDVKAGETVTISPVLQKATSALPIYALAVIGVLLIVCIIVVFAVTRRKVPEDEHP